MPFCYRFDASPLSADRVEAPENLSWLHAFAKIRVDVRIANSPAAIDDVGGRHRQQPGAEIIAMAHAEIDAEAQPEVMDEIGNAEDKPEQQRDTIVDIAQDLVIESARAFI